jgi:hypothetical protein
VRTRPSSTVTLDSSVEIVLCAAARCACNELENSTADSSSFERVISRSKRWLMTDCGLELEPSSSSSGKCVMPKPIFSSVLSSTLLLLFSSSSPLHPLSVVPAAAPVLQSDPCPPLRRTPAHEVQLFRCSSHRRLPIQHQLHQNVVPQVPSCLRRPTSGLIVSCSAKTLSRVRTLSRWLVSEDWVS